MPRFLRGSAGIMKRSTTSTVYPPLICGTFLLWVLPLLVLQVGAQTREMLSTWTDLGHKKVLPLPGVEQLRRDLSDADAKMA
jgi:hypothetical protein